MTFCAQTPEGLLGPLNEVERRHAPASLFVAGRIDLLRRIPRVSIVGSRRASWDGLRRASQLAKILVERRAVVVSGLAEGIDTAAHRSAIDHGGPTIAVLGTSLDKVYPRRNTALQHEIMERHLAVSQFPTGHPSMRSNFPQRNRTMALITHASVIIEAGDTSGSLSQGYEALRLGRPLFISKSVLDTAGLTWPQKMLQYGAVVFSDPEDIFEFLPAETPGAVTEPAF